MAIYDPEDGVHVVRIVYDGAALAGKTTSLRKLAEIFHRPLFSAEEAEGRTLFFDWLDLVGGRFEGSPIRCQIVSVPGQAALDGRRRALLETADAVVLVVDSTRSGVAETRRAIATLRETLEKKQPPIGVILQANKRDSSDALPLQEIQSLTETLGAVALTQTIATAGKGVRETLVFAVRLALDRAQELARTGALGRGPPEIKSGEELLAAIRRAEAAPGEELREAAAPSAEKALPARGTPALPRSDVAPGSIWPPVEGRMLLHEAERGATVPERTKRGDWLVRHDGWRWHSALEDVFDCRDRARDVLIEWAQWHTRVRVRLSDPRLIVLADALPGAWRLWQIVGRAPTLEEGLSAALSSDDPRAIAEQLRKAARALVFAETEMIAAGLLYRAGLGTLAMRDGKVVFTGLVPPPSAPRPRARPPSAPPELLRQQLGPWIESAGLEKRGDVAKILDGVLDRSAVIEREPYLETVAAMVIGHRG